MKEAKVITWVALVWTILGVILIIQDATSDVWTYLYVGVLIASQVMALKFYEGIGKS